MFLGVVNLVVLAAHTAIVRQAWKKYRPIPGQRGMFYATTCVGPSVVELNYGFPILGGTSSQRMDLALRIAAKGGLYMVGAKEIPGLLFPDGAPDPFR